MGDWEKEAEEMLDFAAGNDMQEELDKLNWDKQMQKMLDYEYECNGDRIILSIKEGNVRCLKRVPIEEYWNNPNQISKPASDKTIQEFLSIKDDTPNTLKSKLWIAFGILFILFLALL